MTAAFLGVALAGVLPCQSQLTVEEAVQIALENAFVVRIAQSQADEARARQGAARGSMGPQLSGTAQYVRLAEGVSFSTGGSGFGGSAADSKQINLVLSQLIDISGVSRNTVEAARYQRLSSEMGVEVQVNEVKNLVRAQFYQVLETRALVGVQSDELKSARQRLANAKLKAEAGEISQFDVLRLDSDARRSEQALLDAARNYALARQSLNNMLGRPIETEFEPLDVLDLVPVVVDVEKAVSLAQENRPEVRSGDFLVRAADRLVEVEKGGLKPSLTFSAQYSRAIDAAPGQTVQSLFGVLTMSFPLWDSGVTRSRTSAAREVKEQAAIRLEQTKLGVSLEVRSALTRLLSAREAYDVAVSGLAVATEALRLAQLRFDEGAGILLDVTTAQAESTRAHGAVVTARYQYLSAVAALQKAVGSDDLSVGSEEEV